MAGAIAGISKYGSLPTVITVHRLGSCKNGVVVALKGMANGTSYESNCYAHTDSVFATGVVARWLNGETARPKQVARLGPDLGSDKYPVFKNEKTAFIS